MYVASVVCNRISKGRSPSLIVGNDQSRETFLVHFKRCPALPCLGLSPRAPQQQSSALPLTAAASNFALRTPSPYVDDLPCASFGGDRDQSSLCGNGRFEAGTRRLRFAVALRSSSAPASAEAGEAPTLAATLFVVRAATGAKVVQAYGGEASHGIGLLSALGAVTGQGSRLTVARGGMATSSPTAAGGGRVLSIQSHTVQVRLP